VKEHLGTNMAASVRQRLLNVARENGEDFQLILTRYSLERLLYRIEQSELSDVFVLKGAMLFQIWTGKTHRPTRDLDLLGQGEASLSRFRKLFQRVCEEPVNDDGLAFLADSVQVERLKEGQQYEGLRVRMVARLSNARIPVQVDIGFGDTVTPEPIRIHYPSLLDFPTPQLDTVTRETAIAEKMQAMVMLGMANSRMKDFFDLWFLAMNFDYDGLLLCRAIRETFSRRSTEVPGSIPIALTSEFIDDRQKKVQWRAFLRKNQLEREETHFGQVAEVLQAFLLPPSYSIASAQPFNRHWRRGEAWS